MALDVLGQCILEHKVRKIVAIAGKQKQFKSFTTRLKTHTREKKPAAHRYIRYVCMFMRIVNDGTQYA